MLQPEEAQRFLKISSKNSWIAINYATLGSSLQNRQPEKRISTDSNAVLRSKEIHPDLNTVLEQVQDLRKKIDAQAEEIQRLQQAVPK